MPFAKPGEQPKDRLSDHLDKPVLICPKEYKMIETTYGPSLALMCEVLVCTPERGSGRFYNLGEVPIFWKGVHAQIEEQAGTWVLGRLHQGTPSNPKKFILLDGTREDEEAAEAVMAAYDEDWRTAKSDA